MVEWHKLVKRRKKVEVLKKGAREEGDEAPAADAENENYEDEYEEVMEPHNTTMQLAWWALSREKTAYSYAFGVAISASQSCSA